MHVRLCLRLCTILAGFLASACGSTRPAQQPVVVPPGAVAAPAQQGSQTAPSPPQARTDLVTALIDRSERHFQEGQRQLALGHLDQARAEFDRAVEVLLESPGGGRTDERLRVHFDRLVDRISALEITALAEGDGFTEKRLEPASIDELLAITTFERPAPPPELKETVEEDFTAHAPDIPIPLHPKVLSYVDLFQGRLRDFLASGLQRGTQYLPMIQSVFRAEGLPLDLAYIPLVESAFKPNALSRASARGVWQFMRTTAGEHGLVSNWYVDERSDPEKSTVAAAQYLKRLHRLFDGDWLLALASYNGGPSRVQGAVRRSGRSDFWDITTSTRYLPRETRDYVPMILAAIIIARNPAQYGFDVEQLDPLAYETVTLPRAVDLRRVAEWTDSSIQDIQALNPELRRWTTPVRVSDYALKVPPGTAELLLERIAEAKPSDLATFNWYTVKKGDSLNSVARKLRVSRADLAEANGVSTRARVKVGQQLIIPRAPATALSAQVARSAPDNDRAASNDREDQPKRIVYRVKRGDTLSLIARTYQTTVRSLKAWNRLRGDTIKPGDRLTIYPGSTQAAQ